ncbi:MAG: signal peptidase I [Desulfurococcales archaeon]|nr:signal peptidase I [Desulfurococcales archaeon]
MIRSLIPLALLAGIYVATYFLDLGGILFYAVPTICYLALFFITLKLMDEVPLDKGAIMVAGAISILQLSVYMFSGVIWGFGNSPFDHSWSGLTLNVLYVTSQVLGLEFTRAYLINSLKYQHETLAIILPSIIFALLYVSPLKLATLSLDIGTMKWIASVFLPLLTRSALASYMVFSGGPIPSAIYIGILDISKRTIPVLPNIEWFVSGALGTFMPLLGYVMLASYNIVSRPRLIVRRHKSGIKTIVKASLIITVMTAALMVPSGIFGFKPAVIVSGSMEPTLNVGDVVIISESGAEGVKVGDIVGYVSREGLIVHRVVGYDYINNEKFLILKGDANREPDTEPVHPQQVLGKYMFKLPNVGWVAIYLKKIPQLMFLTLKSSTSQK